MKQAPGKSVQASVVFDMYANEYESKFMDVDLYKDSLKLFCDALPENANILDVACGPGNFAKYILDHRPGTKIFGIDLSPNMVAAAKRNNPTASFEVMDCRTISSLEKKYDAVICSFCFPYLSLDEVKSLIKNISQLSNDKAIFYLSTMEADYSESGPESNSKGDLVYMYYYTEADLRIELEKNGFIVSDVSRIKNIMSNKKEVVDMTIIACK